MMIYPNLELYMDAGVEEKRKEFLKGKKTKIRRRKYFLKKSVTNNPFFSEFMLSRPVFSRDVPKEDRIQKYKPTGDEK